MAAVDGGGWRVDYSQLLNGFPRQVRLRSADGTVDLIAGVQQLEVNTSINAAGVRPGYSIRHRSDDARRTSLGRAAQNAMTLSFPAFAKINLDLRILGVRPDGYHDLRTVFQSLALFDNVT